MVVVLLQSNMAAEWSSVVRVMPPDISKDTGGIFSCFCGNHSSEDVGPSPSMITLTSAGTVF